MTGLRIGRIFGENAGKKMEKGGVTVEKGGMGNGKRDE